MRSRSGRETSSWVQLSRIGGPNGPRVQEITGHRSDCLISFWFLSPFFLSFPWFRLATRTPVITLPQRKFTLETLLNPSSWRRREREREREREKLSPVTVIFLLKQRESEATQLEWITRSNIDKDTWFRQKFLRYLNGFTSFCCFDLAIDSFCTRKKKRLERKNQRRQTLTGGTLVKSLQATVIGIFGPWHIIETSARLCPLPQLSIRFSLRFFALEWINRIRMAF